MERRKPEYPEKTPHDELQKIPHTKARRFKPIDLSPKRDANPHNSIGGQARKAGVQTVTPRVAPFRC